MLRKIKKDKNIFVMVKTNYYFKKVIVNNGDHKMSRNSHIDFYFLLFINLIVMRALFAIYFKYKMVYFVLKVSQVLTRLLSLRVSW